MKALIYANGSSIIGLGHIMRTLTLATELKKKGIYVEYIVDDSDDNAINLIEDNGFQIIRLENILDYLLFNKKLKYDLAIIDYYNLDEHEVNQFYNIANKIIYIDDLAKFNKYNMDILINTSIEALNIEYMGCAKKLLGPKYALLRDEFKNLKYTLPKATVEKIMLTLGGGDENNITKDILDSLLDNYNNLEYHIVLGNSYKYKDYMIRNYKSKNINFHTNTNNMAEIMLSSDLAISAGGNTLYELSTCGISTIAVIIADNQRKFVQGIHRKTGLDYVDLVRENFEDTKDKFLDIFERNVKDYNYRRQISRKMFDLVDGNGSNIIVKEIMKLFY